MAQPSNRNEFKDYCLRRVGGDIYEIEIANETLDDRINDAIQFWWDFNFEGSMETFYKYQMTDTDIANKYITLPDNIIGAVDIFDMSSMLMGGGMFNAPYQFVASDIINWFSSGSMIPYVMAFQHLQLIEEILVGKQPIRYNRYEGKLHIDMDQNRIVPGTYILVKCHQVIDPDVYTKAWSNRLLQKLACGYIKKQWAANWQKHDGIKMAGNVDFSTDRILAQAEKEIAEAEEEIKDGTLPVGTLIG
jgi:hypothetical protein